MTPEQFCYWLQGRAELVPDVPPSAAEWAMIRDHLAHVFVKVTAPPPSVIDLDRALKPSPGWPFGLPQVTCKYGQAGAAVISPTFEGTVVC